MVALGFADGSTSLERWDTRHLGDVGHRRSVVAAVIDMPIGLTNSGPRSCDLEARRILGRPQAASVFPAPLRPMLAATSYQQAQAIRQRIDGKGCSRQAFAIQAKVAEVDRMLRRSPSRNFYEGHPELAFRELAGPSRPVASKHTREGRMARWQLLRPEFAALEQVDPARPSSADSLDAYACLWTARRVLDGRARWVPKASDQMDPELTVPMRIWF